jgi:carbonic anhydrase
MKNRIEQIVVGSFLSVMILTACYNVVSAKTTEHIVKPEIKPDPVIKQLSDGNERFIASKSIHPHATANQLILTAQKGQHPIATILSCSDSRVPVELIFDQGFGDIFVVRVAGNISGGEQTGSIEYGVEHLETPLLVVLGHSQCGAVTAAATESEAPGDINLLIKHIKPAVACAQKHQPKLHGKDLVPQAILCNVWMTMEDLLKNSEIVRERVKEGKLKVVGALYDLPTGKVTWLGTHPDQDKILKTEKKEVKKTTKEPHENTQVKTGPRAYQTKSTLQLLKIVIKRVHFRI